MSGKMEEYIQKMFSELIIIEKALKTPLSIGETNKLAAIIKQSNQRLQECNLNLQEKLIKFGLK